MERRNTILFIGGLAATTIVSRPTKWATPIIDSILLPAHAQTSRAIIYTRLDGELRTPAGGGSEVLALSRAELIACLQPGDTYTLKVTMNAIESTIVVTPAVNSYLTVPDDIVLPLADIEAVVLEYRSNGAVVSVTYSGASLQAQIDCVTDVGLCGPIPGIFCP